MGEIGMVRFRRGLDPAAQEFRPGNHVHPTPLTAALFAPPVRHVYYCPAPMNMEPFRNSGLTYSSTFPVNLNPGFGGNNPVEGVAVLQDLPLSSCPTRSLLLSAVPCDVSESVVRRDLEGFGDVRGVQMDRIRYGILTVHFYDLRHAERALREIRSQHSMRQQQHPNQYCWSSQYNLETPPPRLARALIGGCAVWAEFVIPTSNAAVPDRNNQGTVVVYNSGLDVPPSTLKEIFERFGAVKESTLREAPLKKHQRFIEFFDVRDAEKAVREMNGKEIHGKVVTVDFSRPGGLGRKLLNPPMMAASRQHHHPARNHSKLPAHRPFYPQPDHFSPKKLHYLSSRGGFNYAHQLVDKFEPVNCSGIETRDSVGPSRRINSNKFISTRQSPPSSKQQPALSQKPRMINTGGFRRNNFLGKSDPCFLIRENTTSDCIDSRTTVMIKNIPNKYSLNLLLKTLDEHCMKCNEEIGKDGGKDLVPLSSYDFVYLPIDFNNKCNVGYGFVNLTSPEGACRLYKAFHLQAWEVFNSRKICQVSYARLQGLEAVKEHFRKSKFPREMKEYELPVVFCPPRDGIQLTEPLAVVGDGTGSHPSDSAADQSSEPLLCPAADNA